MSWRLRAWPLAACLVLSVPLAACGDDTGARGPACGDGFCNVTEDSETCPRDCPSSCIPGQSRCSGNTLLTCREDGESEIAFFCSPGQFCTTNGCVESPGPGPDLTPEDLGGDSDLRFEFGDGSDLDAGFDLDAGTEDVDGDATSDVDAGDTDDEGDAAADADAEAGDAAADGDGADSPTDADADATDANVDAADTDATTEMDTDAADSPDANIDADADATTDTTADPG